VVYGPTFVDYDIDVGPIAVSDYFHEYYSNITAGFLKNQIEITLSDNNLINGKNFFDGNDAPLALFNFVSGKVHRLRLINTSAFAVEKITIDGYNMTIIANDFVPIKPYETDVVTLAVGQRSDVLVYGKGAPTDSMWLRAYKSPDCSPGRQGSYLALAGIFYEDAHHSQPPTTEPGPNAFNNYCGNDPLEKTVPEVALAPPEPCVTEILPIELRPNGTSNLWYMGNRTFRVDFNTPQLLNAKNGDLDFPWIQNVHDYGSNASLRFVIQNTGRQPHPMHLHGHNIWILQEGTCTDNSTVFPHGQPPQGHMMTPGQLSDVFGGRRRCGSKGDHDKRHHPDKLGKQDHPFGHNREDQEHKGSQGSQAHSGGQAHNQDHHFGHNKEDQRHKQDQTPACDDDFDWNPEDSKPWAEDIHARKQDHPDRKQDHTERKQDHPDRKQQDPHKKQPHGGVDVGTIIGNYGSCWDGSIVNPHNPARRDVHMLLPGNYVVIQWNQDNPGIWPLHCTLLVSHVSILIR
jgi:FtsP/CotA-like multicopper oxidase with cupredoxin domain